MVICIVSSNQYPTAAERAGRGGLSAVAPAGDVAAVDCLTGQWLSAITGTALVSKGPQ